MSPAWRFLVLLPLVVLALWVAQVIVADRGMRAGFQRSEAAAPGIARACAQHVRAAGTLEETEMGPGFTAFTDGAVTEWSLTAGWRAPDGQTGTLHCEAREEGGQVMVVSTSLSWRARRTAPTR